MGELYLFFTAVKEQWRRILTGSLTLALLGLAQGIGKIRVPSYLYWGVLCTTLFWSFFGAWKKEHDVGKNAESMRPSADEIQKANATFALAERLMQMMHDWPKSPAVTNPFTIGWRPLVGQTEIPLDQQRVMEWRRDCEALLIETAKTAGASDRIKKIKLFGVLDHRDFHIASLECLGDLADIEKLLLQRVLNETG